MTSADNSVTVGSSSGTTTIERREREISSLISLIVYLAVGWSGFFVMGSELLGARILAPYFGSNIFVWGGVVTVFMGSLSVGYLIGGKLSVKSASKSTLGIMLLSQGVLTLPLLLIGFPTLEFMSYLVPDPRYGSMIGTIILFGLPSVVSGMVSPYAVRLLVRNVNGSGLSAGRLFFVSTTGSASGTIITSFYLVLYFDVDSILTGLILVSSLFGSVLIAISDRTQSARHDPV